MNTTSFHIGTPAPSQLCSNAGLMLLATTADQVGVAAAIDTELGDRQNPNLVHTTGQTMTTLALALALGGDDANDVDLLDPLVATGLIDQVPSDSTVHRRHAELAGLGSDGTTAILAGMKSARRAAWAACGTRNPAARATTDNPLVIDLDATEILSHSDKEHATPTWKKHFGFHPLAAIIDHGDGLTGEPAAVLLRPGNAGSNTAADHITVLDQAVSALPEHADGHEWDTRLQVRTDAAGGSQSFLNHLNDQGLAYSIGFPVTWQIGEIASTLGDPVKQGIIRPDGTVTDPGDGYVADITSRMRSWAGEPLGPDLDNYPDDTRIIIRVEHPASGAQLRITDVDGRRVQAFVTNRPGHANRLDVLHRGRGRCEQRIRDLKDCGLGKLPHESFRMNQTWCHVAVLAMSLVTWAGLVTAAGSTAAQQRRSRWWVWEPKTLRARMLSIAAIVVRHARRVSLRFDQAAPHRQLLEHGLARIRRIV
ncbi:hypothetical protein CFAEC_13770 (plasmid) [Corynebacterium faecale]|uniref:IS1380 family transposase n=1 Tax=Corynebacterium faecale TaxID=1758466 RepID=UPI0025B3F9A4|nr:IS1380 family transposase [Corynebacterium faecale]WJY93539.1 hypothetical protein CFAEC_13770 [Corynebacterium faecale]